MNIAVRKPMLGSAAAAFIAKDLKLLIDGKWVAAKSGKTFAVEDPATEEVIAHVPAGDKADIDAALFGDIGCSPVRNLCGGRFEECGAVRQTQQGTLRFCAAERRPPARYPRPTQSLC